MVSVAFRQVSENTQRMPFLVFGTILTRSGARNFSFPVASSNDSDIILVRSGGATDLGPRVPVSWTGRT